MVFGTRFLDLQQKYQGPPCIGFRKLKRGLGFRVQTVEERLRVFESGGL